MSKDKMYNFTAEDTLIGKGVAIVMMMIFHLFYFPERIQNVSYISLFQYRGENIEYWVANMGYICVAVFVVLGGYGTFISFSKTDNNNSVIIRRIKEIYLQYWKIFFVFVPIGIILGAKSNIINIRADLSVVTLFQNLIGISSTFNPEWWFLIRYVLLLLFSPILFKWINRKNAHMVFDLICIITIAFLVRTVVPMIPNLYVFSGFNGQMYWSFLHQTLSFMGPFLIGMWIAKYEVFSKLRIKIGNRYLIYLSSLFLCVVVFFYKKQVGAIYDYLLAPIFIWSSVNLLRDFSILRVIFINLGKRSAGMWYCHTFFAYYFFQKLIFLPRVSVFVIVLLVMVSYFTVYLIDIGANKIFKSGIEKRILGRQS